MEYSPDHDFSMAYVDTADRLSLLLIHGFPLSSAIWAPQVEDLGNLVRIIAPDLRGHGQTDAVPGPYSMELLAHDCADLLSHLAITPPFLIAGLSMGGYVALEFYHQYPELVAGLVLLSTRAAADSAEAREKRDAGIGQIRERGMASFAAGMLPNLLAPQTPAAEPELVEELREIMEDVSAEGAIGALQGMKERRDHRPLLGQIRVPTLIIHGADDAIIPLAEARAMHEAIPHSRLVVVPDAGHLSNLEQPDLVNDALMDFIEEVATSLLREDEEW